MSAIDDAQEEVKPDMTPMIDVVFLMIIFFVCIEFKVLESKLPAYLPKDKGSQSTVVEPQEQLSVKVYVDKPGTPNYKHGGGPGVLNEGTKRPFRFVLEGHRVKWEVGPRPCFTIGEVKAELEKIAKNPASMVPDKKTGQKKLMGCVVEAYPGTYYDDVSKTADVCHQAGFEEINFGGGLGAKK
ncbi:MAG: biopolymer transporter ExbD [Planctomycetes bacterium]|nr:biopolymer transporter ExbD [Planctomycetota bacterium]MCC7397170.1 biopolymer transporter ExbD [Planctomycetota bacterium]